MDPAVLLAGEAPALEKARAVLDRAANRPGHIFNLGHGVLPETDPDVLTRLAGLVHERTEATVPA
jgi:uroporphyrinogen decarboxylase